MKKDQNIQECVKFNLEQYFEELGDQDAANLWEMVMNHVEKPLLETVMAKADNNQSRAAAMLGITRNTLRKKLLAHNFQLKS